MDVKKLIRKINVFAKLDRKIVNHFDKLVDIKEVKGSKLKKFMNFRFEMLMLMTATVLFSLAEIKYQDLVHNRIDSMIAMGISFIILLVMSFLIATLSTTVPRGLKFFLHGATLNFAKAREVVMEKSDFKSDVRIALSILILFSFIKFLSSAYEVDSFAPTTVFIIVVLHLVYLFRSSIKRERSTVVDINTDGMFVSSKDIEASQTQKKLSFKSVLSVFIKTLSYYATSVFVILFTSIMFTQ